MNNIHYEFEKIFIEKKIKNNKKIELIISRVSGKPVIEYVNDIKDLIKKESSNYNIFTRTKKLLLTRIRGEILQKCPGSFGQICCNYSVINLYLGCPLECSYCILQSYLDQPLTIINVDIENIFNHIEKILKTNKNYFFRIGTGELGDSLVYDGLTDFSIDFINFFTKFPNCFFEFKTKTNNINNLLKANITDNIVAGFSLNPQTVIDSEEKKASSLKERLNAMKKLIEKKYMISLHFDPIINLKNFDKEYSLLIDQIFDHIKPRDIAWISLGTFRFTPDLKNMMEINYPESNLTSDEFLENADKKFRYFKPIRLMLYNKVIKWLRSKNKNLSIYLCMESPYIWEKSLGIKPFKEKKMDLLFRKIIL